VPVHQVRAAITVPSSTNRELPGCKRTFVDAGYVICRGPRRAAPATLRARIGHAARVNPETSAHGVAVPARGGITGPAIVYAALFGAVGAYVPYIAVYLGSRGLELGTVGALIALHAAISLIAAPGWGALADGIGDARRPLLVAGLLAGGAAAAVGLVDTLPLLAASMVLLAASTAGMIPLTDSRVVRVMGDRNRFGQARASGSAAFIAMAFAAGAVVERLGPAGGFLLYAPLLAVTGIAAYLLLRLPGDTRIGASPAAAPGSRRTTLGETAATALRGLAPATIATVLRQPRFGLFFVASVVTWLSHAAFQGFVSIRIADLGGDATMIAAAWSIGALVEVPLMLSFPRLARRFGAERLIVVGGLAFGLRALLTSLAPTAALIVAAGAVGGVGFAFVYVGTVTWVAGAAPRSVQATAQGVITGTSVSIGAIGGSFLGGWTGRPDAVAAAGYALGALIVRLALGGPTRS